MTSINWLHITDYHQGMDGQKWLWPTVRAAFYTDLERVLKKTGPLDLVFFTGDLTQKAAAGEFTQLNETLSEMWRFFNERGHNPVLAPVPGNHDLQRPERTNPHAKLIKLSWHSDTDIQRSFWEDTGSDYKQIINNAFEQYSKWLKNPPVPLITPRTEGLVPGDFSAIFEKDGLRLGIIGLNSSFLQLFGDVNYEGKLDLNERQIHTVCGNDADKWCASNHLNLLLTHHPPDWLDTSAKDRYRMEIAPPGRFFAHLCGHLHSTLVELLAEGGATPRRLIQGRSLFGLEKYTINNTEHAREHGYSAGKIEFQGNSGTFHLWPRYSLKGNAGQLRLAPDHHFNLDENDAIKESVEIQNTITSGSTPSEDDITNPKATPLEIKISPQILGPSGSSPTDLIEAPPDPTSAASLLSAVPRWSIRPAPQHLKVRSTEQDAFKSSLSQYRAAWLVADWGLGKEGFLYSTLVADMPPRSIFRLNCEGVDSVDLLTSEATKQWGITFQYFCLNISSLTETILVLDNLPEEGSIRHQEGWARRLDEIVQAALDFAPRLSIVLNCRITPGPSRFPVTQLRSLDEPECARYISSHPDGGDELTNPRTLERLYGRSEGIPMHLDRMLLQLQSVSLEDIPDAGVDELSPTDKGEPVPRSLTQAISTLQNSTNKYTRRSLRLLKVLTILSHGEIFQNLKRFDPVDPFFPDNVQELRSLALIDVVPLVALGADASNRERAIANDPSAPKLLLVPRPVRDYVRSLISEDERRAIVDGALEIYFGSKWREGKPSLQPLTKITVWENGMSGLGNHHSILIAALKDSLARHNERFFKRLFRMTEAYLQALRVANKFRDLQHASEEIFRLLDSSGKRREASRVAFYYGSGLRMTQQSEEAIRLFEISLNYSPNEFDKGWYANLYLDLALAHKHTGDLQSAVKAAHETLTRCDASSSLAQHAKVVIAGCNIDEKDDDTLIQEFTALEKEARNKGHVVVANNVALDLVDLVNETAPKFRWLDRVINSKGDQYNQIRAAVQKAKLSTSKDGEETLGSAERRILTEAYSYLYSQRLSDLFDDCHNALWRIMTSEGKKNVLLRMFRFSSFLWRIFGHHQREQEYLVQLRTIIPTAQSESGILAGEQSGFSYYMSRLRAIGP